MKPTTNVRAFRACFFSAILAFSLIPSVNAKQAIYKTTSRETLIGNGDIFKFSSKGYLVVNLEGKNLTITEIRAFTLNGQKQFTVVSRQNYGLYRVSGPGGEDYEVYAAAASPGTYTNTFLESVYYQGKVIPNTILPPGGQQIYVPKIAISVAQIITQNPVSLLTSVRTASGTVVMDIKGSLASNTAGETFSDAVNRLANSFVQVGYTQVSP